MFGDIRCYEQGHTSRAKQNQGACPSAWLPAQGTPRSQRDPVLLEARKQSFASGLISTQTDRLVTSYFTSDANTGLIAWKRGSIPASAVTGCAGGLGGWQLCLIQCKSGIRLHDICDSGMLQDGPSHGRSAECPEQLGTQDS